MRVVVNIRRGGIGFIVVGIMAAGLTVPVAADRLTSPSYQIDTSVGAPLGGQMGSTNYKMVVSAGEAAAGISASSSYKLGHGYVAQLAKSIQLTVLQPTLNLGTITPGVSKTSAVSSEILTDAPGYSLSINQNANLTSGSNTIPAIPSGTIATPAAWTEGTTKGLGITMTAGPSLPVKWGTTGAYMYAATPTAVTNIYSRIGYTGGVKDTVTIQTRLDINPAQLSGTYSNIVTLTATTTP